jgi:hypothetical protein
MSKKFITTISFALLLIIFGIISFVGLIGSSWTGGDYKTLSMLYGGLIMFVVSIIIYIKYLKTNHQIYSLILNTTFTILLIVYFFLSFKY